MQNGCITDFVNNFVFQNTVSFISDCKQHCNLSIDIQHNKIVKFLLVSIKHSNSFREHPSKICKFYEISSYKIFKSTPTQKLQLA